MITNSKNIAIAPTPSSIYVVCLWALLRAATPILGLIGQYNINKSFMAASGSIDLGSSSFFEWLLTTNKLGFITILISLAFIVIGIGLVARKKWGRVGFLIISVIVLLWNLRAITSGRYSTLLYSVVALGLSYWYFRQPKILQFFGAKDNSLSLLNRKIFNATLDLVISLGLLAALLILEIVGLLQFGMR